MDRDGERKGEMGKRREWKIREKREVGDRGGGVK